MKRLPELKVEFIHDYSIPDEELIKRINNMYDILFSETIKMMEESSKPKDIAFLKKFPWMREHKKLY